MRSNPPAMRVPNPTASLNISIHVPSTKIPEGGKKHAKNSSERMKKL
jgi:hypothetical protein